MRTTLILLIAVATCAPLRAGERPLTPSPRPGGEGPGLRAERKGPLKDLPSKPAGAHLAKIKSLGDGAWVDLGAPTPDPKWGKAPGRAWASRMPFAPDLRGAFLFGEGAHGAVVNGHYMDDLWFYDINRHRWVCVYPGINVETGYKGFTINKDGFETNPEGHPVPVASMVHAYNVVTYDTDRKRFMSLPNAQHYCWNRIKGRLEFLTANIDKFYSESHTPRLKKGQVRNHRPNKPSPWMYDTQKGHWQRYRCKATKAPAGHMGLLQYIPTRKMVLSSTGGRGSAWYDPEKKDWSAIPKKGELPKIYYDFNAVYDSKRDRVYMGGGLPIAKKGQSALWCFDVKTETFKHLEPKGSPGTTLYATNRAIMNYDSVNDVVVLFLHGIREVHGGKRGIYVYHPDRNEWETVSKQPKELMPHIHYRNMLNGFYDPELNVHILHRAGDSRQNGTMSAWRYKRRK